jgi:hypothetical protein
MTRISTFIALLTLVFAARWSHQESPTATDGRGDDLNGSDLESGGVEAEYSICFTIPATQDSGVMHVRYLVTDNEWAAIVGADLGFSRSPISPHIATAVIHCTKERVELYSPWQEYHHVHTRQPQRQTGEPTYWNQTYEPRDMISRLDETDAWILPPELITRVLGLPETGQHQLDYVTEKNADLSPKLSVTRVAGAIKSIRQTLAPGWLRVHSAFEQVGQQYVSKVCDMEDLNSKFTKFFQWTDKLPGSHPRHGEAGLQFHNGGRRVEMDWIDAEGVVLPKSIKVKLGNSSDGMLLRSSKLIHSRRVSAEWIRSEIAASKSRKAEDLAATNFGLSLGRHYWGKSPETLSADQLKMADEFRAAAGRLLETPRLSTGDKVSILRSLVILAAATDESEDRSLFREAVTNYSNKIMETAGGEGLAAMMLDMFDMLRFSGQEPLIDIAYQQFRTHIESQTLEQQFSTLMGIPGPDDVREFNALSLLNVVDQMAKQPELTSPTSRILPGLLIADYRVEYSLRNHLAPESEAFRDSAYRKQRQEKLVSEFRGVLERIASCRNELLKNTALKLQQKFEASGLTEP